MLLIFSVDICAQTRIAILGDIEKNSAEVDLLTERLSKDPSIALVERSEIDKIIAEHKLSLMTEEANIKLGSMLGAKGVIIIKSFEWEGKKVLSARLVAAESGAIIGFWVQDTPSKEAFHFADAVKFQFTPLFSKLNLERKDMAALSILNIRSVIDSPESKELERKITLLLSQRLMLEKSFVVLERWRLSNIAWEKELDLDENKFWTGSSILDGSVESLLDGKGTVKVVLRLRSPEKKEPVLIETSGSTLDLKGFVENMIPLLKAKLGADSSAAAVSWNMDKEADFYFNEAQWLLRAGAFERAREAADTSSALGKTGPEIEFIRIKSYLGSMRYSKEEENLKKTDSTKSETTPESLEEKLSSSVSRYMRNLDKLALALDTYMKFIEANPNFLQARSSDANNWRLLRNSLLWRSSELIKNTFLNQEYQELRGKAHLVRILLKKFIALTRNDEDEKWIHAYVRTAIDLIFDNPEDAVTEYKRITTKEFSKLRHYEILSAMSLKILNHNGQLLVWRSPTAQEDKSTYKFFIDITDSFNEITAKLERTDKVRDRIDALVLAGKKASPDVISDIVWEKRDTILEGAGRYGDCQELLTKSVNCPSETIVKLLLYAFSQDQVWEEYVLSALLDILRHQNRKSQNLETENKKIAEAFYSYYDRIKDKLESGKSSSFSILKEEVRTFSSFRPRSGIPQSKTDAPVLLPVFSYQLANLLPQDAKESAVLRKTQFQNGCLQLSGNFKKENMRPFYILYYDEKYTTPHFLSGPSLLKVKSSRGLLLKNGNDIYFVSSLSEIYVYGKTSNWQKLTETGFQNPSAMTISHDMLYISYGTFSPLEKDNPSAIVQVDTKNGAVNLLASSRRNPPLSPLDNCPSWHPTALACSDNGILVANIVTSNHQQSTETVYELNIAKNEWKIKHKKEHHGVLGYSDSHKGNIIFKDEKQYCIFNVHDGILRAIDSRLLNKIENHRSRSFKRIMLVTENGEKLLKIEQLEDNLFAIGTVDLSDGKLTDSKFSIEEKYFSSDSKFLCGFAASEKKVYIILNASRTDQLSDAYILGFDLEDMLKTQTQRKD